MGRGDGPSPLRGAECGQSWATGQHRDGHPRHQCLWTQASTTTSLYKTNHIYCTAEHRLNVSNFRAPGTPASPICPAQDKADPPSTPAYTCMGRGQLATWGGRQEQAQPHTGGGLRMLPQRQAPRPTAQARDMHQSHCPPPLHQLRPNSAKRSFWARSTIPGESQEQPSRPQGRGPEGKKHLEGAHSPAGQHSLPPAQAPAQGEHVWQQHKGSTMLLCRQQGLLGRAGAARLVPIKVAEAGTTLWQQLVAHARGQSHQAVCPNDACLPTRHQPAMRVQVGAEAHLWEEKGVRRGGGQDIRTPAPRKQRG